MQHLSDYELQLGEIKRPPRGCGAPPKNAARAQYDQLMKQGIRNSEACRIVGISRSSGTRWRHGHCRLKVRGHQEVRSNFAGAACGDLCPLFLRVRTDHDRGPAACPAQHPCHCPGVRAQSVKREPRDPSQQSRTLWQLPTADSPAQCLAQRRRSRQRTGKIARNQKLRDFVRGAQHWTLE
jgi:transposase, IS30 family